MENFDVDLMYFLTRENEINLTNPDEFQEAITGLKISKVHGPIRIPMRALKHAPQQEVPLLVQIFHCDSSHPSHTYNEEALSVELCP